VPAGQGTTAVEVYYERFALANPEQRLNGPMEEDLVAHCPDLERLREVVIAYSRAGYKTQRNLTLILDWYREPSRYQRHTTDHAAQPAVAGRAAPNERYPKGENHGYHRQYRRSDRGEAHDAEFEPFDPEIKRKFDEHRAKRKAEGSLYYR
jgi:hypothetical protein